MGLFNAYHEWKNARYEKHISQMKDENKCPECYGRGFLIYPANEYVYLSNPLDCPGCNGSGLYSEWSNLV